jgi:thiosulfate/3-mercaptopyruvate sulfurtransferase
MEFAPVIASPDWVNARLDDSSLVIVDCRFSLADPTLGYEQYLQGHIPGAFYLDLNQDLSSPVQRHGGRHPLPDFELLAKKFSQMGISAKTTVVAYDDSRFAFAARLWWLLRCMGHGQIAVLDGGFAAYQAAGYPVSLEIPGVRSGDFVPQFRPELLVPRQGVQQRSAETVLIDSREAERYRGEREPIDPVAGHIPGAVNYPWQQVTNELGKLRSPDFLQQYWAEVAQHPEAIVYCGSGVTACVNLLAMAVAGLQNGKLYVGSWSDWCSYPLDSEWNMLDESAS